MGVFEACFGKIEAPSAKPKDWTWQQVFYNACDNGSFMASLREATTLQLDEACGNAVASFFSANLDLTSFRANLDLKRYRLLRIRGGDANRFNKTKELNDTHGDKWALRVDYLIEGGADPRWVNKHGQNALQMLMRYANWNENEIADNIVELTTKLLDAGAKETINANEPIRKRFNGFTALQLALMSGYSIELVRLLLKSGADPNVVKSGNREHHPLLLAINYNHQVVEMTSLLRRYGAVLPGEGAM